MKKAILLLLAIITLCVIGFSQNNAIRLKHFNLQNGLALKGYDPVCYLTETKAEKGRKEISYNYNGVVYYFTNENNRKTFIANPAKYEPQYGGWCAYAMGEKGEKVDVDPKTFKIIDGRLYLFYNAYFNNTLKSWNKDESNLKTKADKNWLVIYK